MKCGEQYECGEHTKSDVEIKKGIWYNYCKMSETSKKKTEVNIPSAIIKMTQTGLILNRFSACTSEIKMKMKTS